ncbi:MAG: ankyrin repeat domain-containing protein [Anaerolineae bacterium]|nr:ankyrin repeat domain-containing protein [Phycisphaerae bacterium]
MSDNVSPFAQPARSLPSRPSLEHLKNQAKDRLPDLRSKDPAAQLAHAQLLVAREYGFASWRKLRAFVDAIHDVGERLIQAVRRGDVNTMREILDRHPELADATTDMNERLHPVDTRAMRLIHVAISENQLEAARLLIARGANLNVRNADGRLPLHDCFELGRDEIKDLLLAAGAQVDVIAATAFGMRDRLREILDANPALTNDRTTNLTPLGWCGYGGDASIARMLIEHGAIVDRPPFDELAWQSTSRVANIPVARELLDAGASPNAQGVDLETPMHLAIRSHMTSDPHDFVRLLLERGADPAIRNKSGRTVLDEALAQVGAPIETYFPRERVGTKQLDRTIELLRKQPTANDQTLVDDFMRAAEDGRGDDLRRLLDAHPHLLNRRSFDLYGQTALHKAAWRNRAECVRMLLDRGADVRIRDRGDNAYALHFAAENADLSIVRMLVEAGSDRAGEDDMHLVGVLGWATCFARVREDVSAYLIANGATFSIWSAIALNRGDLVREFVARDRELLKARLSKSDHRRTPLHHAAKTNRPEMVALLLELGADPTAMDSLNQRPLALAGKNTDRRIIDALLATGAPLDFAEAIAAERFDAAERHLASDPARIKPGGRDERALALAALQQSPAAVRWLIDHGADINAKVVIWDKPAAPLHLAVADGNAEIIRMLIAAGADLTIRDAEFNATPADWADHFGRAEIISLFT